MIIKKDKVLVIKRCVEGSKSKNGFVYPKKGIVECNDWEETKECGNGLHGWTLGFEKYEDHSLEGNFVVILVDKKDGYVELDNKVKFRKGKIILNTSDIEKAHFLMKQVYPDIKLHWNISNQGDYSTANQGYNSTANQGNNSTANQGYNSTANQGYNSTANQGYNSTANQGYNSTANQGVYSTANQGNNSTANQGKMSVVHTFGSEIIYRNNSHLCAIVMFYGDEMYIFRGGKDFEPNETIKIVDNKIKFRYTDTPHDIKKLREHEIFVFGSNLNGNHVGGAAKLAKDKFGAIVGQGSGLQGKSYAFPTLDREMKFVSDEELKKSVNDLIKCACNNTKKIFFLTKVGCGIAGGNEEEIKKFFKNTPANIIKPKGW